MNQTPVYRASMIVLSIVFIGASWTQAYDTYSKDDDATNCRECHGDFRDDSYVSPVDGQTWGNLHNIHRSSMLSSDCDVCQIGSQKLPVYLD